MSTPLDEQETTIGWYRDSDECFIYTSDSTVMTKLDKLVEKSDKWALEKVEREAETHEVVGKNYKTDKRLITFRADIMKSTMSDERRAEYSERMKTMRAEQLKNQK